MAERVKMLRLLLFKRSMFCYHEAQVESAKIRGDALGERRAQAVEKSYWLQKE